MQHSLDCFMTPSFSIKIPAIGGNFYCIEMQFACYSLDLFFMQDQSLRSNSDESFCVKRFSISSA